MFDLSDKRKARLLGSLFHDIGKFQYRAEKTNTTHSENSSYFMREYLSRFKAIQPFLEDAIRMAANHHNEYADDAVKEADGLSAADRVKDDHYFAHRPLLSIFRRIQIGRGEAPKTSWYIKPSELNIENVFPIHEEIIPDAWKPDVQAMRDLHLPLWESMKDEITKIPETLPFEALFDTLYALMERWTCHVCSAGYGFTPDISLFDHSRAVAAYADCIAETDDKDKPFLVIEGDVSGIQNFIYKLSNPSDADQKKTAKTLRGRSLYVNLLAEAAADFILKKLELFRTHLLMSGGGHFHILAPNKEIIKNKLLELEKSINQWLIEEHYGELGLVLVYENFSPKELTDYGYVKRMISMVLTEKKEKKNFNLFTDYNLFGPFEPGVKADVWDLCKICNRDMEKTSSRVCPACLSQQNAGEILPKTKYIAKIITENFLPQTNYNMIKMRGLKTTWVLITDPKDLYEVITDHEDALQIEINTINETDFVDRYLTLLQKENPNKQISLNFRIIGKYTPMEESEIMPFDKLAEIGEGYSLLHILRMDVDNLGQIFGFGLKGIGEVEEKKYYSLSRIATLSREMNLFFSGYINKIAEKYNIYITYSGGDDLFVVGKWNNIIDFAFEVREDFKKFTCYNPNLSISGGAALVRHSFPIRRGAELAGEMESKAKAFQQKGKNAISIFDTVYDWQRAKELLDWAKKMVVLINKNQSTKKYRSLLRYFKEIHDENFLADTSQTLDWIWKVKHSVHYALSRRAEINNKKFNENYGKSEDDFVDIDSLKLSVFGRLIADPTLIKDISMPVIYALLYTRVKN